MDNLDMTQAPGYDVLSTTISNPTFDSAELQTQQQQQQQQMARYSYSLSKSLSPTSQWTPPLTPTVNSAFQSSPTEDNPPNFHNYLRAFYHFHPTTTVSSAGEESSITVPINAGDIILVHSIQPNGWADGTVLASGARGWLPTNYCEHYDNDAIRFLLSALTNAWEFIRSHENDEPKVFAKQDYVRSMIAGVRMFLERSRCLTRDDPLVKEHVGIRRMRKGLLGDLSAFVKAAKTLQEKCIDAELERELLWDMLDELVLKAFKLVTRAVRFLDIWTQDVASRLCVEQGFGDRVLPPLTPPAEVPPSAAQAASPSPSPSPSTSASVTSMPALLGQSAATSHATTAPNSSTPSTASAVTLPVPASASTPAWRWQQKAQDSLANGQAVLENKQYQNENNIIDSDLPRPRWASHSTANAELSSSNNSLTTTANNTPTPGDYSVKPPPATSLQEPSLTHSPTSSLHLQASAATAAAPHPHPLLPSSPDAHTPLTTTTTSSRQSLRPASIVRSSSHQHLHQPMSFAENHAASSRRPSSIVVAHKRTSVSHRWSCHKSPTHAANNTVLASEKLGQAHDAFLGHIGAFIGLGLSVQSRSSAELLATTQRSVASCQGLLTVVNQVWEQDCRRSKTLDEARNAMQFRLEDLVQATQEVFQSQESYSDEPDSPMPEQQASSLVQIATLCVRSAGECVAKTKVVIERIGDFDFETVAGLDAWDNLDERSGERLQKMRQQQHTGDVNDGFEIIEKPLPSPPSYITTLLSPDSLLPPEPTTPPPPPPPAHATTASDTASISTVGPQDRDSSSLMVDGGAPATLAIRTSSLNSYAPSGSFPPLEIRIPHSPLDISHPLATPENVAATLDHADSMAVSSADGSSIDQVSMRHSEMSAVSRPSTVDTSPDQSPVKEKFSTGTLNSSFTSLSDSRSTIADPFDAAEAQLLAQTYAHELVFNNHGQITGGSLPALVERLTTHDSTPEATFVNTFYLTFRLFTTPCEFAQTLVDRFDYVGESPEVAGPVRLRVYNVLKGWLETHWRADTDKVALPLIMQFASSRLQETLPSAGKRILTLANKVSEIQEGTLVPRLVSSMGKTNTAVSSSVATDGPMPAPAVSSRQLNNLRTTKNNPNACSILDFEALELARQFTLIESKIFCSIQPEELLACEWTKKNGSRAPNVRAMSTLSTDLANLVADTILQLEEPKKRAVVIKQWVKIAKKCFELNNYDSLMAIICSLNSSMVSRLRKTWDLVPSKTMARFEQLKGIVDVSRNYAVLRQRLQNHVAPCLPFVGIYLTDLTFIDVGNQTTRQLARNQSFDGRKHSISGDIDAAGSPTDCVSVINFDKHMRTAKIIGDLQRFQIPYRLTPVLEMQEWMESQILRVRTSSASNVQNYYRRSLKLEPREAQQQATSFGSSKSSPIDSANSSFASQSSEKSTTSTATSGSTSTIATSSTRDRFDFWNNLNFPLAMGNKEKVSG